MKHSAEYDRFTALVDSVLAVPHAVIAERVQQERVKSAAKQVRPGPKPKAKVKPSASGRAVKS